MDMVKVSAAGVVTVLLALQFKKDKTEYGLYLCIAASVMILLYALQSFAAVVDVLEQMHIKLPTGSTYLNMLIKITGITYIAEFASNICKESGYLALAGQIEVFGKLSILALSMPVLLALLDTIGGFLG